MAALSDFLENKVLDWLLRGQAIGITGASAAAGTGPTSVFVGLHTATPTDVGGGTEVTGGSYARVAIVSGLSRAMASAWACMRGVATSAGSNRTWPT